jgi:hypothetical protein
LTSIINEVARIEQEVISLMDTQTYAGSCHCGRIRFEMTTDLSPASECNCSICFKKGYLHHMVPPERFRLVAGEENLETYQFGTFTARHLFCRYCGVAPFYRPRADPTKYMVNVRCLDGVDLGTLRIEKFDGRSWEVRPDAPYTGIWKD